MSDIVKRLKVRRGKHDSLASLLESKGFYGERDRWRSFLGRLNKTPHTKEREIEVTCFRPTEEEHRHFEGTCPSVYVTRNLKPASLFEVLALIPDRVDLGSQDSFFQTFGDEFVMFAHGHWQETWLRNQEVYLLAKYGRFQSCDCGILNSHSTSWYVGFREV